MSGFGELWGRPYSWWRSNAHTAWLDPHRIQLGATPIKGRVLQGYVDDPSRKSTDGNEPCVERTRDGRLVMHDGKHRTLAARQTGRMLRVRLADARDHAGREAQR